MRACVGSRNGVSELSGLGTLSALSEPFGHPCRELPLDDLEQLLCHPSLVILSTILQVLQNHLQVPERWCRG